MSISIMSVWVYCVCWIILFFFFKQKTAYEMRISDWSSDVCSSDLSTDVASLGLETAQGLVLTTAFDVDQNDATKEFSARFKERDGSNPTMVQAGVYSAVLHYLKAVEATGPTDADPVMRSGERRGGTECVSTCRSRWSPNH